jgi:hypothetical protein
MRFFKLIWFAVGSYGFGYITTTSAAINHAKYPEQQWAVMENRPPADSVFFWENAYPVQVFNNLWMIRLENKADSLWARKHGIIHDPEQVIKKKGRPIIAALHVADDGQKPYFIPTGMETAAFRRLKVEGNFCKYRYGDKAFYGALTNRIFIKISYSAGAEAAQKLIKKYRLRIIEGYEQESNRCFTLPYRRAADIIRICKSLHKDSAISGLYNMWLHEAPVPYD